MREVIKIILGSLGLLKYIKKISKLEVKKSKEYPIIKRSYENFLSSQKSSLLWTTHKGASSLLTKLFFKIENEISFNYYDFESKLVKYSRELDNIYNPYNLLGEFNDIFFQRFNNIYGPLRQPYQIDRMDSYNHVFFLRDPRDVIISSYYWFGFNSNNTKFDDHFGLSDSLIKKRDKIQSLNKDDACIYLANEWLLDKYLAYMEIYNKYESTFFIPYKLLKNNPDLFLKNILKAVGLKDKNGAVKKLAEKVIQKKPSKKDIKHRRSGKSSQYLNELHPKTIEKINLIFNPILNQWDF
tara:strand:- start:1530 stop:2420 length:891 start_codon:yes stop_codon:yes gene_type:complete